MGKTNAQVVDTASPVHRKFSLGSHHQALEDGFNTLQVFVQLPKLAAQLDADVLTDNNYVTLITPLSSSDARSKFNTLLAKLDADAIVGDTNYAALLTAATDGDLPAQWAALLAKLDVDSGVPLTTYTANNVLPFVKTINQEKGF